ncbi:MAG: hypothetical protein EAZ42_07405 [Verrucomicrobia bacterium]|nr:MAG: hypothetical protein EAZ42_07405 [Verrucomicrobiota bacterium]
MINSGLLPISDCAMNFLRVKLLSALIIFNLSAHAAATSPSDAALGFLEKVKIHNFGQNFLEGTAMLPTTNVEKKQAIDFIWQNVASQIKDAKLTIGSVNTDGNLAAVMILKIDPSASTTDRVLPLGLIRIADEWLVAPVPASFENTRAMFSNQTRENARLLENWMLTKQMDELKNLQQASFRIIREQINAHVTHDSVIQLNAREALEVFLNACATGDRLTALALLGGHADEPPNNWLERIRIIDSLKLPNTPNHWLHQITLPQTLRVISYESSKNDVHTFGIAALITSGELADSIIEFDFIIQRTPNLSWQIDFNTQSIRSSENGSKVFNNFPTSEFVRIYLRQNLADHLPTTEMACHEWQQALFAPTPGPLLKLAQPKGTTLQADFSSIMDLWKSFHDATIIRDVVIKPIASNDSLWLAAVHIFSSDQPSRIKTRSLYLQREENRWLWIPNPNTSALLTSHNLPTPSPKELSPISFKEIFQNSTIIQHNGKIKPPSDDLASEATHQWLDAMRGGRLLPMLSSTAQLSDSDSSRNTLIRNLSYDLLLAKNPDNKTRVTQISHGKFLSIAAVEIQQADTMTHQIVALIETAHGVKIIPEISLFASKRRQFLNQNSINLAERALGQEVGDDLRHLFDAQKQNLDNQQEKSPN